MVSRPHHLLALLRGLSPWRLVLAALCVLWLSPPPEHAEWPALAWGVAAPATLVVLYVAFGLVGRLRAATDGRTAAAVAVALVLASSWIVRLLPPMLWVHVIAAMSAIAYAAAARLRTARP